MSAVRSVYRELFRATRVAFGEDLRMLTAARSQITQGFRQDQTAQLSEDELQQKLQHAKDVGLFLRRNIVQGKKNEENDAYVLNIHKDTELGDNDSVKKGNKDKKNTLSGAEASSFKCCSS